MNFFKNFIRKDLRSDVPLDSRERLYSGRIISIDVFRALVMFFMLFVNDVTRAFDIPAWIGHAKSFEDALHFADVIFPLFLFIVGLSLPFALTKRLKRGDSKMSIFIYILTRSASLIIMGFLHGNLEHYNSVALMSKPIWQLLITISFFLVWIDYPKNMSKSLLYFLKGSGILLLIVMSLIYKGGNPTTSVVSFMYVESPATLPVNGLKLYWWGILGIIGWAYFISSIIFIFVKGRLPILIGFFFFFLITNVIFHLSPAKISFPVVGDGSSIALTLGGVLSSIIYLKLRNNEIRSKFFWLIIFLSSILIILSGFILRPYTGGISKSHSTPAYTLICIGLGIVIFGILIYLVDIKRKKSWYNIIRPAGTSTLTTYLIPYIVHSITALSGFYYSDFLIHGTGAIIRSLLFSLLVVITAGLLERIKIRIQL